MCADLTPKLVRRAIKGNLDAQRRLIERLTPEIQLSVYRMLRRWRTGPAAGRDLRQEVEDMVQEVFLELVEDNFKTLRRWSPKRGALCTYVCHIAMIRTAEVLRSRRSPWKDNPCATEDLDGTNPDEDPEGEAAWRELLNKVVLCLVSRFSPEDALLFDLLFVKPIPRNKVPKRVGKTRNTVDQWVSRLYKRARECRDQLSELGYCPQRGV